MSLPDVQPRSALLRASLSRLQPYIEVARVDHWLKNGFVVFGMLVALCLDPARAPGGVLAAIGLALLSSCLLASCNYVLNELMDARVDRLHPLKQRRPFAAGTINVWVGLGEWIVLGVAGLAAALLVHRNLAAVALAFWTMGIIYNVPPLRAKDWPYVDVLSESVNNPLRLMLGWFALLPDRIPPLSLLIACWLGGAALMAIKRLIECRGFADSHKAAAYRPVFAVYDADRLLIVAFVCACGSALFGGIFMVRFRLELVLTAPLLAAFFAYCLRLGLTSPRGIAQAERFHRDRRFLLYAAVCVLAFVALMFVDIPSLYDLFNVARPAASPLWRVDG